MKGMCVSSKWMNRRCEMIKTENGNYVIKFKKLIEVGERKVYSFARDSSLTRVIFRNGYPVISITRIILTNDAIFSLLGCFYKLNEYTNKSVGNQ